MSSRYALYEIDKLRDRFTLASGVPKGVKPHYNISPTQSVPVVVSRDGKNEMELMKWGLISKGAVNANSVFRYKTFTTRSESIFSKPTWRTAVRTSRCLIPANGFYEWKKTTDSKQPFYIKPLDQSLFAFAGISSSWTDPEGNEWATCSIITIDSDAEDDMTPSRLPIIIRPNDEADWLNPEITDVGVLYRFMTPYRNDQLDIIKVGDGINSTKIDTPQLIQKVATAPRTHQKKNG
jgi:putative SOS response-associated peptidase YedK